MTAVYIILAIAAALFLLSLLRVGVHIAFGDELRVTALAGPARIQVLPKPDKPKKEKPAKEKKPEDGKKKEKKLSLTAEDIRTVLPAVWESLKKGLGTTRRRLRIEPMRVSAPMPLRTMLTSAPTSSQRLAMSFMNDMRVASIELAAYLIISADGMSVNIMR